MASGFQIARRSSSLPRRPLFITGTGSGSIRCASTKPSHHNDHKRNHVYVEPSKFIGSWEPPKNPREAEAKLALLRRDYAKQVKQVRKQYIFEMELLRQEQMRKDEARREEIRKEREERKKTKAAAAEARAAERKAFEEDFRQTLLKERTEKLEYWRMTEKKREEKREEKKELLRQQSSIWIDEDKLESTIMQVIFDEKKTDPYADRKKSYLFADWMSPKHGFE
ncbi:hypothetical protein Dimus_002216 [Dionaea muscipula]